MGDDSGTLAPPVVIKGATPSRAVPLWSVLLAIPLLALTLRTAVTALSPLLPRVAQDVPLSPTQVGLVGALPPICFAIAGVLGPVLLRRWAAEQVVLFALVLAAAGQLWRPWAGGAQAFMATSVIALLGMGIGNVVLPVLVKAWFPGRIARVTGLYVVVMTVGGAVPALTAVPVAEAVGSAGGAGTLGWQVAVASWGAVSLLVVLPWLMPAASPRALPPGADGEPRVRLPLWRSRRAWGLTCLFGATSLTTYAMWAWLPTRLTEAGLGEASAGGVLAIFTVMGVPAAIAVPRLVARTTHHTALTAQFAASFAVGEVGFLLSPTQGTVLWAVLAGWGSGAFPLALTLIGLRSRTHVTAGALSGFVQSIGYTFAGLGPVVTGVLREITGGWTASFAVLVAVVGLMVLGGRLAGGPGTVDDDLVRLAR